MRSEAQILTRSQVRIHSGSASQDEALTEAAEILGAAGAVTGEYLSAMKEREATVSTYMGNELAIPHGTNDAKSAILASALSVTRYDGGVDWSGEKVTFVIGIAGVGDEHLEILSRIAELFSDDAEVAKLKRASSEEELLELLSAVNAS
ncbi:PTS sugar transporter subunit IIA [Nesterenkonia sp. AN1]|uniref:PTS sugar transporter subunit IIA n=1 Tax=Nesterenkonia sp. AN1 TaxID=652017 RepID=UPI0004B6466F|nr:PTS sugar transporter subunit IIA [Nesterenkonia sp. AN1]